MQPRDFTVIFQQLEQASQESDFITLKEDVNECAEISALREIVLEIEAEPEVCLVTT
jgi:hypothetical protein